MSFSLHTADGIATIRIDNRPTPADVEQMISNPQVQACKRRLYVFSDGMDLSADDIRHLARFSANLEHRAEKIAAVVLDDVSFGLSRMFEVYREDEGTEARAFRDETEALQWLRETD